MEIKYFNDTDTLLITFNSNKVCNTRDLSENILMELDEYGNLVSMTIEHAEQTADIFNFSYQQVHGITGTVT